MRIGVVSDTHMPMRAKTLPKALVEGLRGVDCILHAGDWTSLDVADMLGQIAPVDGVSGNNDGEEIVKRFGKRKIVNRAGFRIGMVHGDGFSKTTELRAREAFGGDEVDIILFGHSHIPFAGSIDGVFLFNPGSPTDKRRQPLYSYGILELTDRVGARHFEYEDKS